MIPAAKQASRPVDPHGHSSFAQRSLPPVAALMLSGCQLLRFDISPTNLPESKFVGDSSYHLGKKFHRHLPGRIRISG